MLDAEALASVKVLRAGVRSLEVVAKRIQGKDALLDLEDAMLGVAQMITTICADIDVRVYERHLLKPEELLALHGAVGVMRSMARDLPADDPDRSLRLAAQAQEVSESLAVVIVAALDAAKVSTGSPEWKTELD